MTYTCILYMFTSCLPSHRCQIQQLKKCQMGLDVSLDLKLLSVNPKYIQFELYPSIYSFCVVQICS